ncbi:hypothetical protein [Streptomyces phaeochromogenes]|uniref:hypothetical protein n=1 Tax=Streptomyces phaeochromogenes TaxID=1923 RepID=UPI0033C655A7
MTQPLPAHRAEPADAGTRPPRTVLWLELSRLGTPVSWIGRLGTDSAGDRVVRELTVGASFGVHAERGSHAPTGPMLKERLLRPPASHTACRAGRGAG